MYWSQCPADIRFWVNVNCVNRSKYKDFWMLSSVKFVLCIISMVNFQINKLWVNFFFAKDHTFSGFYFLNHFPCPGWLPLRRGNGMSLVTTDRRGCSGEHCHEAWPIWTVLWSNISIRGKFEISQKGGCWTQCVTTACSPAPSTHSAVLTFPTHYFATIVLWIEYTEVAILLLLLHWKMQSILINVML